MARSPAIAEVEELPEADRLEGFPHPRETVELFGHAGAERTFAEAFASGRIHHAWLITGPMGIGKATLAYKAARYVLAEENERDVFGASLSVAEEASASRQVRALSHPNLLLLRRPYDFKSKKLRTEISVDEVRRIKSFLAHTAGELEWRVVIVDAADELNANAANALLKSLEEPPSRTIFLLVAASSGRLLPTLRSRCRTLALEPLHGPDLKRAVQQALNASEEASTKMVPDPGEWPLLEQLAEGSVRGVLALKGGGGLEIYGKLTRLLSALPKTDWASVHSLGDELGSAAAEQRFELFFDQLLGLLARLIRFRTQHAGESDEGKLAARLIGQDHLAAWAGLWETIAAEKTLALALNLDKKTLILDTFARLERAVRSEASGRMA